MIQINRKVLIAVIAIMICLVVYPLFSRLSASKNIKSLTLEIAQTTTKLENIKQRYDSLATSYSQVYSDLERTREDFGKFKNGVDSIISSNISSLKTLNNSLKMISSKYDSIAPLYPSNNSTLIFN